MAEGIARGILTYLSRARHANRPPLRPIGPQPAAGPKATPKKPE